MNLVFKISQIFIFQCVWPLATHSVEQIYGKNDSLPKRRDSSEKKGKAESRPITKDTSEPQTSSDLGLKIVSMGSKSSNPLAPASVEKTEKGTYLTRCKNVSSEKANEKAQGVIPTSKLNCDKVVDLRHETFQSEGQTSTILPSQSTERAQENKELDIEKGLSKNEDRKEPPIKDNLNCNNFSSPDNERIFPKDGNTDMLGSFPPILNTPKDVSSGNVTAGLVNRSLGKEPDKKCTNSSAQNRTLSEVVTAVAEGDVDNEDLDNEELEDLEEYMVPFKFTSMPSPLSPMPASPQEQIESCLSPEDDGHKLKKSKNVSQVPAVESSDGSVEKGILKY